MWGPEKMGAHAPPPTLTPCPACLLGNRVRVRGLAPLRPPGAPVRDRGQGMGACGRAHPRAPTLLPGWSAGQAERDEPPTPLPSWSTRRAEQDEPQTPLPSRSTRWSEWGEPPLPGWSSEWAEQGEPLNSASWLECQAGGVGELPTPLPSWRARRSGASPGPCFPVGAQGGRSGAGQGWMKLSNGRNLAHGT